MTRPVPEGRSVGPYEWECAAEPMQGYLLAAAEDVADLGDHITTTHPHVIAAAHMQGCAAIHAAHVTALSNEAIARALDRIADVHERMALAQERAASNLFEVANAINGHADAVRQWLACAVSAVAEALSNDVAPAIGLLGDELAPPLDRIADNTES